jgi:hypothetical protein
MKVIKRRQEVHEATPYEELIADRVRRGSLRPFFELVARH